MSAVVDPSLLADGARPRVVLTGYSRGIGRATALALSARDAELFLFGRPSAGSERTVAELAERRATIRSYDVELADADSVIRAARSLLADVGPPDVVIHNAGIIERQTVESTSTEQWDRQLDVNLRAPFVLTRELLPRMRGRGCGRHLYVGSIASTVGTARAAPYCASKWGLVGFVKSLAEELRDSGLMAMVLLPGSVDTEMLSGSGFTPRLSPEEVARTIVYFSLDASTKHNGSVVEMFGT